MDVSATPSGLDHSEEVKIVTWPDMTWPGWSCDRRLQMVGGTLWPQPQFRDEHIPEHEGLPHDQQSCDILDVFPVIMAVVSNNEVRLLSSRVIWTPVTTYIPALTLFFDLVKYHLNDDEGPSSADSGTGMINITHHTSGKILNDNNDSIVCGQIICKLWWEANDWSSLHGLLVT